MEKLTETDFDTILISLSRTKRDYEKELKTYQKNIEDKSIDIDSDYENDLISTILQYEITSKKIRTLNKSL